MLSLLILDSEYLLERLAFSHRNLIIFCTLHSSHFIMIRSIDLMIRAQVNRK